MAQRLIIIDDLDDSEGAETYRFGIEGVEFEIDLNEENIKSLREALLPFITSARHKSGRVPTALKEMLGSAMPASVTAPAALAKVRGIGTDDDVRHDKEELVEVRTWAKKYGIALTMGRVPLDVWDAWRANDLSLLKNGRLPDGS